MAKLKYTFTLPKKAVIRVPKGPKGQDALIDLGQVATYTDINGKVSVTIMLNKKLPIELIKLLQANPTQISIIGQPKDVSTAELTDLIDINES